MNHEEQKQALIEQGKEMGLKRGELNVLSTDPFLVGSPKDYEDATWAAELWDRMMARRKKPLHLRGFHYWVQSQGVPKPDGVKYAYVDPGKDWGFLLRAAQLARYLGIGEWKNLADMKHPNPNDYDNYWVGHGLARDGEVNIQAEMNGKLTGLVDEFLQELLAKSPRYHSGGYQLWHTECWVEKSSMGAFIDPICRRFEAVYQPLVGQSSVEKVNMSYERALRAAKAGKKVRIFYISDWDRYGLFMVPAVARKLEFFSRKDNLDIKLTRIALTDEQIDKFQLPKAPKHGEAVVELDALEAIHPGELGKIVEDALKPYYDAEKPQIVMDENRRMREKVRAILEEKLRKPLEEAFSGLDLEGIAGEVSLKEAINPAFQAPIPEHKVKEDNIPWVYDSSRKYWAQFEAYQQYKASRTEEAVE